MTQRRTAQLVANNRIRLVTAHPDDSLWHASLIAESGFADEALLTPGSKGRDLRNDTDPTFDVSKGHRVQEEIAAAAILGLQHVLVYGGRDGKLTEDIERLVPQIALGAVRDGVDILVSNALTDHPDHRAAGDVAIKAARLAAELGHPIGVLLIHHSSGGDYWSEATPDSMQRTFTAAKQHDSQWRMEHGIHADWPVVPGGFSIHPDDLASLAQYPLLYDASYTFVPAENVTPVNASDLLVMGYTEVGASS